MSLLKYYHDLNLGKVGQNAHPVHPITVHYPITFLMTSFALDIIPPLRRMSYLPSFISRVLPATATISQLAYYANIAGLLSLVPASITGTHELYAIWKNTGTRAEKQVSEGVVVQDHNERTLKAGYYHAGMNVLIEGISLYNWLSRRNRPGQIPTDSQSFISVAGMALLIYSAYMGGELVYKYGIGVQRQGEGLEEKKEQWKNQKLSVKKDE